MIAKKMKKNNLISARIDGEFALVSDIHSNKFMACLDSVAEHPRANELLASALPTSDTDFWFSKDDWRSEYRPYIVNNGVLQIPIKGGLLNKFPFQFGSYLTGYEYIWQAYLRGLNDPAVKSIVLDIDSPGGLVAGCFTLVDKMFQLKGTKPIYSFANESAYSAAYALASLGDTITVSKTGGVGSIGVLMTHYDYSGALQQSGVKITFITAGKHKVDGNSTEPLSQEVADRLTAQAEDTREMFIETVARNRPSISADEIRATEALCYTAKEAITAKLADNIADFDESIQALQNIDINENNDDGEDYEMTEKSEQKVDVNRLKEEAKAEGYAEGEKAAQARFSAIVCSPEAKDRGAMALHLAANTNLSVEAAVETLKVSLPEQPVVREEAAANHFNAAMSSGNPEIEASAEAVNSNEEDDMVALAKAALPSYR